MFITSAYRRLRLGMWSRWKGIWPSRSEYFGHVKMYISSQRVPVMISRWFSRRTTFGPMRQCLWLLSQLEFCPGGVKIGTWSLSGVNLRTDRFRRELPLLHIIWPSRTTQSAYVKIFLWIFVGISQDYAKQNLIPGGKRVEMLVSWEERNQDYAKVRLSSMWGSCMCQIDRYQ
jgi:hypothetical protein